MAALIGSGLVSDKSLEVLKSSGIETVEDLTAALLKDLTGTGGLLGMDEDAAWNLLESCARSLPEPTRDRLLKAGGAGSPEQSEPRAGGQPAADKASPHPGYQDVAIEMDLDPFEHWRYAFLGRW